MNNRWIASKFGLFNFWYYENQEFDLADGKILFRGTNGSGKSVTTQSFIPLLLDGDKRPNRIDPFGISPIKIPNIKLIGSIYLIFIRYLSELLQKNKLSKNHKVHPGYIIGKLISPVYIYASEYHIIFRKIYGINKSFRKIFLLLFTFLDKYPEI